MAKLAGVSVATVSRVLNDSGNVRPETALAVEEAIRTLNYHPNFLGRTLRRLETMKILIMVPTISNQFYSRVVRAIQKSAAEKGYHAMLGITGGDPVQEADFIEMAKRRLVDGVIFLHTTLSGEEITRLAEEFPLVVACEIPEGCGVSSVNIDNTRAARDATAFLIENGHRRIALVCAGELYASSRHRITGYLSALQEAGIPKDNRLILGEGLTFKAGRRAAEAILKMDTLPDAVFAIADSTAIGLISTFAANGVRVCEDISVMGFDDNPAAEYYLPPLTTVGQPQYEIGQKAFELLIKKILDPAVGAEHILLPHRLVQRESVKIRSAL